MADITVEEAQGKQLEYPEGGWIGQVGGYFPSEIQWLYKSFNKQYSTKDKLIPEVSTTTYINPTTLDLVTFGSGKTTDSIPIQEQVSLDWLSYAIQKRLWALLYQKEKIDATRVGLNSFLNELVYVLDIAVRENIFTSYSITSMDLNRFNNKVSFAFRAEMTQTILSVNVTGSLYK